jgi:hypothetical protein
MFSFATTPSNISCQLYVLKAIEFFEYSDEGKNLIDGTSGTSWQRGVDKLDTRGSASERAKRLANFRKEYRRILFKAQQSDIDDLTMTKNLYQDTDTDFVKIN